MSRVRSSCVDSPPVITIGPRTRRGRGAAVVFALGALTACASASAQPRLAPAAPSSIPKHVYVAPCLRPTIDRMLELSPTFRAQVQQLAQTRGLGMAISLEVTPGPNPAAGAIRRFDSGLLLAVIRIHSLVDKEGLVAHEVEHVLEQIERVPLERLARRGDQVWLAGSSYETLRAIEAGRQVSREMRAAAAPAP
jgi:hypothetical protein